MATTTLSSSPLTFSPHKPFSLFYHSSAIIVPSRSFKSKGFRLAPTLRGNRLLLGHVFCSRSAGSQKRRGDFDPELRLVLELATDSELFELERILFSPSYFGPLLKSVANRSDVDYAVIGEDLAERERFIMLLESQFLYLAADARSTLRGWRPSYRDILLGVRRKLNIACSSSLSTEDLEVEIFLHLLQDYVSGETNVDTHSWEKSKISDGQDGLEFGLSQRKVQTVADWAADLKSLIMKGGAMLTLGKIYQLFAGRLSGKMVLEAANYQIKREIMKEKANTKGKVWRDHGFEGRRSHKKLGGKLAAMQLESRVALLAARKGLAGAASRYIGFRSMMMFLGPLLWGTFLADIVIQMLGTDYARILRAIYAFAQIRITRTYKSVADRDQLV